jgi:glycosyltransferase
MLVSNSKDSLKLISIITVVYNNVGQIKDAIKSVLSQNYKNIEFIVIDGNSNDGTQEILEEFRNQISVLLIEPDKGLYDALNKGINLSNGEVIGFLHSDDFFANNNVINDLMVCFNNENADVVYGDLDYLKRGSNNLILRHWQAGKFSKRKLNYGWMPPHPTFYAKRELYESHGGFNLKYKIAADYDCMLRILKQNIAVSYIPKVLVKMRAGGKSNKNFKNIVQKSYEDYIVMKNHNIGGMISLICKNLSKLKQFLLR